MFLTFDKVFPDGCVRAGPARPLPAATRPTVHRAGLWATASAGCCGRPSPPTRSTSTSTARWRSTTSTRSSALRGPRRLDRAPRRGRVRRQASGHQLLHDPRDLRVRRPAHPTARAHGWRPSSRCTAITDGKSRSPPEVDSGLRLRTASRSCSTRSSPVMSEPLARLDRDPATELRDRARHPRRDRRGRRRGPTTGRTGEPGLLDADQIDDLVERIHHRSDGQSRRALGRRGSNLDLYQVNCTFFDALGGDDAPPPPRPTHPTPASRAAADLLRRAPRRRKRHRAAGRHRRRPRHQPPPILGR